MQTLKFRYYIKHLPVLLLLLFIAGGCGKKRENKIAGKWEMVDIIDHPPNNKEQWVFEKPNTVHRIKLTDSLPPAGIDTGFYSIQVKGFNTFLNISDLTGSYGYNGKWEVVKLNKEIMIIVFQEEDAGLIQKEFIKIE